MDIKPEILIMLRHRYFDLKNSFEFYDSKNDEISQIRASKLDAAIEEMITTILIMQGLCTFGGTRQWLKEILENKD